MLMHFLMTTLQNYFTLVISLYMHLFACFPSVSTLQPWQSTNFLKPVMFQRCGEWSISVDLKCFLKLDPKSLLAHCILLKQKLKGLRAYPLPSILLKWLDSSSAEIDPLLLLSKKNQLCLLCQEGNILDLEPELGAWYSLQLL